MNIVGLLVISGASSLYTLAGGFLLAVFGQNVAGAAYQAMMPDMVPQDQWGTASGYMGVASLLGTIGGLAVAGIAPGRTAYFAMAMTAAIGAVYSASAFGDRRGGSSSVRAKIRNRRDFLLVFFARFAVMFGQTLLMTFVLYFFQDVMHVSSPATSTALIGGLALVGAVASSILLGALSDRSDRPGIVFFAGIPMAIAAGAFALVPDQNLILLFAILYGLGYGAYLSVDWALALESIPDLRNVARDLGIWGIASNLPLVLAPAVGGWLILHYQHPAAGYRALFLTSGLVTLFGSFIVLGVRSRHRNSFRDTALRLLVVQILRVYVGTCYRVRVWGRLPRKRGATLVVANHGHDLDGMVVPQVLFRSSPVGRAVYSAGSERIFEPGFLATRTPGPFGRMLASTSVARIVWLLGVRPIENMPRTRPFVSLAYEVYRRHGNLSLSDVFTTDALWALPHAKAAAAGLHLRDVWRARLMGSAQIMLAFSTLKEPYRSEVRKGVRGRIEQQLETLEEVLRQGETLYLTPEGRYTDSGRLSPFRASYNLLWPLAERVYLAATSYDPFTSGRMRMLLRFVAAVPSQDPRPALLAARPVTVSQVLARVLLDAGRPVDEEEIQAKALAAIESLPKGAFLCPDLASRPRVSIRRALRQMVQRDYLLVHGGHFELTVHRADPRFANVPDMVAHQAAHFEETRCALATAVQLETAAGKPT
ncbi:MAG: MFS transporter [Thermaerobacter sp.]|nr:MFS transporter [Thermaerobacter sp.]